MSTTRFVSFQDAKTEDEAETFVVIDTGSAVLPVVGHTVKVTGGFQVRVYSLDGHRTEPGGVPIAAHTTPQNDVAAVAQFEKVSDAFADGGLRERPDFEGPQSESKGWSPYSNPQKPAGQQ